MHIAVFIVVKLPNGKFAATTRAVDRGEGGRIGLPGGKVDPGESLVEAAIRESKEEGWCVQGVEETPFHIANVEGFEVFWFRAENATMLESYKEQHRIKPIEVDYEQLATCGYGNNLAMEAF